MMTDVLSLLAFVRDVSAARPDEFPQLRIRAAELLKPKSRPALVGEALERAREDASRGIELRATDIARVCNVDLKTVHNWFDKGEIVGHKTPGRHLRFKVLDAVVLFEKYQFAVPARLANQAQYLREVSLP